MKKICKFSLLKFLKISFELKKHEKYVVHLVGNVNDGTRKQKFKIEVTFLL